MKARLLLYRASDLWNGNPLYKDFTDSRGVHLFPQEKDPVWWERAAEAHLECITACEKAGYKLYRDPSNDPIANYSNLFIEDFNCEALMYYNFGNTSWGESCSFPRTLGGWAGYNPTQAQVDAYEMADGTIPITGYNADGAPIINPESNYTEVGFAMEDDPQGLLEGGCKQYVCKPRPLLLCHHQLQRCCFQGPPDPIVEYGCGWFGRCWS